MTGIMIPTPLFLVGVVMRAGGLSYVFLRSLSSCPILQGILTNAVVPRSGALSIVSI